MQLTTNPIKLKIKWKETPQPRLLMFLFGPTVEDPEHEIWIREDISNTADSRWLDYPNTWKVRLLVKFVNWLLPR